MRLNRIKVQGTSATYHCMSRVVSNHPLLDKQAKEVMRAQLRKTAYFCGIEILTYCIMDNHFHILIRVPYCSTLPSDQELIDRVEVLYGVDSLRAAEVRTVLRSKDSLMYTEALKESVRQELFRNMYDLSAFMKLFKQRFSIWYNKHRNHIGTFWTERFKSVLVEEDITRLIVAAYIDLNPVRAKMVKDPKDYRFSGYSDALAGNGFARGSLKDLTRSSSWQEASQKYRRFLFMQAKIQYKAGQATIPAAMVDKVIEQEKGKIALKDMLCFRFKHFKEGVILGSKEFVGEMMKRFCNVFKGAKKKGWLRPRVAKIKEEKQTLPKTFLSVEAEEVSIGITSAHSPRV